MKYLKELRQSRGVSQQVVADYLEITRQAYSNYENGNRAPDTETLLKLGEYFDVSVDTLLRGKENTPAITSKDERDISKTMAQLMEQLADGDDLMFDGDPMSDEARTSMLSAMRVGLEMAKVKNKERFSPKTKKKG